MLESQYIYDLNLMAVTRNLQYEQAINRGNGPREDWPLCILRRTMQRAMLLNQTEIRLYLIRFRKYILLRATHREIFSESY